MDDEKEAPSDFLNLVAESFQTPQKTSSPSNIGSRSPSPVLTKDGWKAPVNEKTDSPSDAYLQQQHKKRASPQPSTTTQKDDISPKKLKTTPESTKQSQSVHEVTSDKQRKRAVDDDIYDSQEEIWQGVEQKVAQQQEAKKKEAEKVSSWISKKSTPAKTQPAANHKAKTTLLDYFAVQKKPQVKEEVEEEIVIIPQKTPVSVDKSPKRRVVISDDDSDFDTTPVAQLTKTKPRDTNEKKKLSSEEDEYEHVDIDQLASVKKQPKPVKSPLSYLGHYDTKPRTKSKHTDAKPNALFDEEGEDVAAFFANTKKQDSDEDEEVVVAPKKLFMSPPKQVTSMSFGVTIPDNLMNPAESLDKFKQFKASLLRQDPKQQICVAAAYRYNVTNFRKVEKKKDEDIPRLVDNLIGYGFFPSTESKPFFLALIEGTKDAVPLEEKWDFVINFFESPNATKICFGCQESLKPVLQKKRHLKVANLSDPKIAAWIYEPELDSYDFLSLVLRYLKEEEKEHSESNILKLSKDLLLCMRLWTKLSNMLTKEDLMVPFATQEMPVTVILAKMELVGIAFDSKVINHFRKLLQKRIEELSRQADKSIGRHISINSPAKISKILFDELKLTVDKTSKKTSTSKNRPSTSEAVLLQLRSQHKLPGILLEYRHCQKLLGTYVDGLEQWVTEKDKTTGLGRIHTGWMHTNTATGRLASVNPNLQNLPRTPLSISFDDSASDQTDKITIRDAFCSKPGFTLAAFDYSQLEMRILTHMSNDNILIEFFKNGQDIHKLIAGRWLNKPPEKISSQEREQAKRIVYGILYGMGSSALSGIIGVSVTEAAKFIETFLGKFPTLHQYIKETISFGRTHKYVKTLFQRRRLLPDIQSGDMQEKKRSERQALNSVIQGTAADVAKIAMIQCDELIENHPILKDTRMLLQIHDELVFEVDNEHLDEVVAIIAHTMENVVSLNVELPVKVSTGSKLGSLKTMDDKVLQELKLKHAPKPKSTSTTTSTSVSRKNSASDILQSSSESDDVAALMAMADVQ